MLTIEFRFVNGMYHATPWQRHVNEADVEWPPSPWRILRSLIAVWYRKAGYDHFAESDFRALMHSLSEEPPVYSLPAAVHSNKRHYMPVGEIGKTTLVYDGFLKMSKDSAILVHWPNLSLTEEHRKLLDYLLDRLTYLGRAESTVIAKLLQELPSEQRDINCAPLFMVSGTEQGLRGAEGYGPSGFGLTEGELTKVLTPMTVNQYQEWKNAEDTKRAQEASAEGNRGRGRSSARRRNVATELPTDLFGALCIETNDLGQQQRLDPPGSKWAMYVRPQLEERTEAVRTARLAQKTSARRTSYNVARFALHGVVAPSITETVDVADICHLALLSRCGEGAPTVVSGREEDGSLSLRGHQHLFILPEDADCDGKIDHIVISSVDVFTPVLEKAIRGMSELWSPAWWPGQVKRWNLFLEGLFVHGERGSLEKASSVFSQGEIPLLARSRRWVSQTPYLHPWHKKRNGKFSADEQIVRELMLRGLPRPIHMELKPSVDIRGRRYEASEFRRERRSKRQQLPDTRGTFWELEFSEMVQGPLALGSHCHFGLGLFVPAGQTDHAPAADSM